MFVYISLRLFNFLDSFSCNFPKMLFYSLFFKSVECDKDINSSSLMMIFLYHVLATECSTLEGI